MSILRWFFATLLPLIATGAATAQTVSFFPPQGFAADFTGHPANLMCEYSINDDAPKQIRLLPITAAVYVHVPDFTNAPDAPAESAWAGEESWQQSMLKNVALFNRVSFLVKQSLDFYQAALEEGNFRQAEIFAKAANNLDPRNLQARQAISTISKVLAALPKVGPVRDVRPSPANTIAFAADPIAGPEQEPVEAEEIPVTPQLVNEDGPISDLIAECLRSMFPTSVRAIGQAGCGFGSCPVGGRTQIRLVLGRDGQPCCAGAATESCPCEVTQAGGSNPKGGRQTSPRCGSDAVLQCINKLDTLVNIWSSDPVERMEQIETVSEDLRETQKEWQRYWMADQPNHLTPFRVMASVDPCCCDAGAKKTKTKCGCDKECACAPAKPGCRCDAKKARTKCGCDKECVCAAAKPGCCCDAKAKKEKTKCGCDKECACCKCKAPPKCACGKECACCKCQAPPKEVRRAVPQPFAVPMAADIFGSCPAVYCPVLREAMAHVHAHRSMPPVTFMPMPTPMPMPMHWPTMPGAFANMSMHMPIAQTVPGSVIAVSPPGPAYVLPRGGLAFSHDGKIAVEPPPVMPLMPPAMGSTPPNLPSPMQALHDLECLRNVAMNKAQAMRAGLNPTGEAGTSFSLPCEGGARRRLQGQVQQNAQHVHLVMPNMEAHCERLHGGNSDHVVLEGDVHLTCRRHGQTIQIKAQRVVVHLEDGTFTVDSAPTVPVQSKAVRVGPNNPVMPAAWHLGHEMNVAPNQNHGCTAPGQPGTPPKPGTGNPTNNLPEPVIDKHDD